MNRFNVRIFNRDKNVAAEVNHENDDSVINNLVNKAADSGIPENMRNRFADMAADKLKNDADIKKKLIDAATTVGVAIAAGLTLAAPMIKDRVLPAIGNTAQKLLKK